MFIRVINIIELRFDAAFLLLPELEPRFLNSNPQKFAPERLRYKGLLVFKIKLVMIIRLIQVIRLIRGIIDLNHSSTLS